MKSLLSNKRGSTMAVMVIGMVVTVIITIVGIMVALLISGQLSVASTTIMGNNSTYNSNATSAAINATNAALWGSTFSALSMSTILPFILVAALIIASVVGIMGYIAIKRRE